MLVDLVGTSQNWNQKQLPYYHVSPCKYSNNDASAAGEHWPRLLKETGKVGRNIKVDWNKWVDEDEEEDKPDDLDMSQLQNLQQFGGGGMPGMGGMGGMPGMADMNFEDLGGDDENINGAADSDDEDLPPLEKE